MKEYSIDPKSQKVVVSEKELKSKPPVRLQRLVRRPLAFILERIYGVRGSLKPPLGGPNAGPLYPLLYRWWRATNALYRWSGLPDRWYAWRTAPNKQAEP